MIKPKILVVDDDPDIAVALEQRLGMLGYDSILAEDGIRALDQIRQETPDIVLLDLELPNLSGLEVLRRLQENTPSLDQTKCPRESGQHLIQPFVVVMTAYGSINDAVEAMKFGAYDFLTKPFDFDHLALVIQRILDRSALLKEVKYLREEVNHRYAAIIGKSPTIQEAISMAQQVAPSGETILLLGETGTGKDIFARTIHHQSGNRSGPFMAINCSAFPETLLENELFGHEKGAYTGATEMKEGKIEATDGGTVFLDEIGDMPIQLQGRLLRLLQDQEFHRVGGTKTIRANVRFIAATNKDLQKGIAEGTFREDLFFRLNILPITLPPLRERLDDLPELANYFLTRHSARVDHANLTFSPGALEAMMHYSWPGNIRELESVVTRAAILSKTASLTAQSLRLDHNEISEKDSVNPHQHVPAFRESMERHSRFLVTTALQQSEWNQTKAAEALCIHRSYLVRLVKRLGITPP